MPDFDVDFCQDGRERVIEYVKNKYGAQCVSQIATFGTMASKAVIRDVGRVMDFPYGLCDSLSKAIPVEGVKPVSLKKAREMEPEINAIAEREEGVPELLELAGRLEDLTRNIGMHAGGVLIAPGQLTDFCPLYCADSSASVVSQFDKDDVEAIGLVKFDFLGLRTLTILDWAMRHVARLAGGVAPFTLETLPLDDARDLRAAEAGEYHRGVPARIARHEGHAEAGSSRTASRTSSRWSRCTAPARWT